MSVLDDLVASCRLRSGDEEDPPLWSDDEWRLFLSEAQREACIRAKLIHTDDGQGTALSLVPGVTRYELDKHVLDVTRITYESDPERDYAGEWDLIEGHLILAAPPRTPAYLKLAIYRLPLEYLMPTTGPEIRVQHHYAMCEWALHLAFLKPDSETFNEQFAMRHEALFTQAFGERPSANVQRKHRRKSPRVTRQIDF